MRKRRNIIPLWAFWALLLVSAPACAEALAADALDKAQILFLQKQYVQAIDECVKAVKEHPDDPAVVSQAN
jgi:hypothetical protein